LGVDVGVSEPYENALTTLHAKIYMENLKYA
jgi:hypothetical protein